MNLFKQLQAVPQDKLQFKISQIKIKIQGIKDIKFLKKHGVLEWLYGEFSFLTQLQNQKGERAWLNQVKENLNYTQFTEELVKEILSIGCQNPRKIISGKKASNGIRMNIDIETDDCLYEVKSRTYFTSGTAGEKILGVFLKYSQSQELYNKKLYVVCVAYQQHEANSKFQLFGNGSKFLNWFSQNQMSYIKATDLLESYLKKTSEVEIAEVTEVTEAMTKETSVKPLIKWAGGKRSVMSKIFPYFPDNFNNYFEPFLGGGSVFLELWNKGKLNNKKIHLNDLMCPLINMYQIVRDDVQLLIEELQKQDYQNSKEQFNLLKSKFNSLKLESKSVEQAALFIYLNRTGFNGMYRENKKGEYNIPFGKYKNPQICNKELLLHFQKVLEQVHLTNLDYLQLEDKMQKDDFIYMDPPYHGTFNQYNQQPFDEKSQTVLCNLYSRLTHKGCKVALSNNNHPFIRHLYSQIPGVKIIEIPVKRSINSDSSKRSIEQTEVLIINY